jgi:phosphoribosyl-ATP pyrophosphohydrolase
MSDTNIRFLSELEEIVRQRIDEGAAESYTAGLVAKGRERVAQKVGEEALELAIASTAGDRQGELDEAADLVYHLLVLLVSRDMSLADVAARLEDRHRQRSA